MNTQSVPVFLVLLALCGLQLVQSASNCSFVGKNSKGWVVGQTSKVCYLPPNATTPQLNFNQAQQYCKQRKAQLVSIHSFNENALVFNMLQRNCSGCGNAWIGLSGNRTRNWTDRTSVNYLNWASSKTVGNCTYMSKQYGQWYNSSCNALLKPICKSVNNGAITASVSIALLTAVIAYLALSSFNKEA